MTTPIHTMPTGKRERIRAAIAVAYGASPPANLHRGWATEMAARLGVSPISVSSTAWMMRTGRLTGRGPVVGHAGSLVERLQQLEAERPGLTRSEQATILGTTEGMVRDTAYRVRRRGGLAPLRRRGRRPEARP